MLTDRSRVILFWFTIGMILLVAAVAVTTILRACGGSVSVESSVTISPTEISLCAGEQRQFTVEADVEGDIELTWEATGGTISPNGLFTASDEPGDYQVIARQRGSRRAADAIIHITACTPTPTPMPSPTPMPTATPTPQPTATPPPADPQGDISAYEGGAPVGGAPGSVDIRAASVSADLRIDLQPTENLPAELGSWAREGEVVLWITVYEPVPDPPPYTDWLFALDLDGNTATGRPPGSVRINPDLGDEAVVGALYDPTNGDYVPYFLVWDAAQENWTDGPEAVRFYLSESRMLVGMALPLETLTQVVAERAGVTTAPEGVKGRAAVLSFIGEQAVIDFYPDRPE